MANKIKSLCEFGCETDCSCPCCGGSGHDNWFDRELCPEPCGSMHIRCVSCGAALDGCPFEDGDE